MLLDVAEDLHRIVILHLNSADSLMALCLTAKQFPQLCAAVAREKLQKSPRFALRCVFGLPHLQQLALVQRAESISGSWKAVHARCLTGTCGVATRKQLRDGCRHAWSCDDHHPELLTALTLLFYRRRQHRSEGGLSALGSLSPPITPGSTSAATSALLRLARSKDVRALLAVILNEDPVAASAAARALGLLGSEPPARDVAVRALVRALLDGSEHELPHGARALQELARRHAPAIATMLDVGAIPALVALLEGGSDRRCPHLRRTVATQLSSPSPPPLLRPPSTQPLAPPQQAQRRGRAQVARQARRGGGARDRGVGRRGHHRACRRLRLERGTAAQQGRAPLPRAARPRSARPHRGGGGAQRHHCGGGVRCGARKILALLSRHSAVLELRLPCHSKWRARPACERPSRGVGEFSI